jgi:ribosomal protein S27AE
MSHPGHRGAVGVQGHFVKATPGFCPDCGWYGPMSICTDPRDRLSCGTCGNILEIGPHPDKNGRFPALVRCEEPVEPEVYCLRCGFPYFNHTNGRDWCNCDQNQERLLTECPVGVVFTHEEHQE